MLAQNFKTAAELELSDAEQNALVKFLGILERGEIRHAPVDWNAGSYQKKPSVKTFDFNMGLVFARTECGTAGCIAGGCDCFFGTKFSKNNCVRDDLPPGLAKLFCPYGIDARRWEAITPAQAAIALRNYLTHGEPRWEEALAA